MFEINDYLKNTPKCQRVKIVKFNRSKQVLLNERVFQSSGFKINLN